MGIYKFDFEKLTPEELNSQDMLEYINHVIYENMIIQGVLICKNCKKEYIINNGVANMVLNDDEV